MKRNIVGEILNVIVLLSIIISTKAEESATPSGSVDSISTTDFTNSSQAQEQYGNTSLLEDKATNEITPSSQVLVRLNPFKEEAQFISATTTEDYVSPYTVLEYQPITPSYHPHPVTIPQIIPPGQPWPASAEGYETTRPTKAPLSHTTLPPNLVDRFPELTEGAISHTTVTTNKQKPTQTTTTNKASSHTVLDYKPTRPFYYPKPSTPAQLIPPGDPLPDSPTSKPEDSPQSTSTSKITTTNKASSHLVLDYKPTRPFYYPKPSTPAQLIPPGDPLPDSPISKPEDSPQQTSTSKTTTNKASSHLVLDYKPTRPFHYPKPSTPAQLIPPGDPLPDSPTSKPEDSPQPTSTSKITTNKASSHLVLDYKPSTSFYYPKPSTPAQLIPPGDPLPDSPTSKPEDSPQSTSTSKTTVADLVSPQTVLEYQPINSPHLPNPVTIPQIIPPGEPWPDSPEGYQTTSKQEDFPFQSTTKNKKTTTEANATTSKSKTTIEDYVKPQTVLGYVPITSFYHPHPVTLAQIIPPGKPLPASAEEKKNASASTVTVTRSTLPPNLVDRFPELTSHLTSKGTTSKSTSVQSTSTTLKASSNYISLEYKPQRPWYHPRPGNTIGQIIKPGKPWPASPAGYPSFSVTKLPPWLRKAEAIDEDEGNRILSLQSEPINPQSSKENLSLIEPNALYYYEPVEITTSGTPFTSGTQKTTVQDIIDILKEVHNITLTTNNSAPIPSHLLPFDGDNNNRKELISPSVINPHVYNPERDAVGVLRTQKQQQSDAASAVHVYDGTLSANDPHIRERIFPNPKFAPE